MWRFLIVLAVLAGLGGLSMASQATFGVAVIAFGCLLAICARLAQAVEQHEEIKRGLEHQPR
jgi:hypothetical protein